jgi:hypothetical protein
MTLRTVRAVVFVNSADVVSAAVCVVSLTYHTPYCR